MQISELLTPEAAARVKQLELFARTRVEGFLKGANRSKLKGISAEFMQHRAYIPGDDPRHLDWRVLARTDRLVTREFEEFTNLDVTIAVDFSGSMGFGEEPMSKADFALHSAALLAFLLNKRNDRFALACCSGSSADFLPCSGGQKHLAEAFRRLVGTPVAGETQMHSCAMELQHRIRRRSVIIVLSDCYEDPQPFAKALGQLSLRGHDVILYQVTHADEHDLDFNGFTLFRDLETGQTDAADPLEIRESYREVVAAHTQELQSSTAQYGIDFKQIAVTERWDEVLAALLNSRKSV